MSYNISPDDEYRKKIALTYGSIRNNVQERALELGYRNASGGVAVNRLSRESGLSTATLYFLLVKPEKFRSLDFVTLAKLCRVLKCQPGDLFEFVPGLTTDAMGLDASTFGALSGAR